MLRRFSHSYQSGITRQEHQSNFKHIPNAYGKLVFEIGHVFARFQPNSNTKRVVRTFRKNHLRQWDSIVSFNYDVIFEYSLPENLIWIYVGIDGPDRTRPVKILKPHGSINWVEDNGNIGAEDDPDLFPDQPIVVAPTHLKFIGSGRSEEADNSETKSTAGYLNQSEQIADIWRAMEEAMKDAKGFVFVGYSFPSFDLYFSSVLRSVLATRSK